ncbi:AMP-binding protein [Microbacterium sp. A204]|uniref:AMP-binding protein n=1 Tax=Microbacterium sp. A204 TaxID=3457321 RepID=UPI003FD06BD2
MDSGQIIRKLAETSPDHVAVIFEDRSLTASELLDRSFRLANALRASGLEPGDRIATLGGNALRSIEELVGLAIGGFVRVPLHQGNSADRHRHMIEHSGARALIVDAGGLHEIGETTSTAGLSAVLVDDEQGAYEQALAEASSADPRVAIRPGDSIQIGYTGGTTGLPKGAIQSHRGWFDVTVENLLLMGPPDPEHDVYLAAGPISGAAGSYVFSALARAMPIVIAPDRTAATAARLAVAHGATVMLALPPLIEELAGSESFDADDFEGMRMVISAGAPLRSRTIREFITRFGPILTFVYGQSECLPIAALTPALIRRALAGEPELLQSCGLPTLRSRIVIVDADGREVPRGEVGEIAADAAGAMVAYWANPDATRNKFTADGLVRTGDIGLLRHDGVLVLSDRVEDVLTVDGHAVYPSAVEDALFDHAAVREVVVIGQDDDDLGQLPRAIVTLREADATDADELRTWWRSDSRLAVLPLQIEVVDGDLPRTPAGKLSRALIREAFSASRA